MNRERIEVYAEGAERLRKSIAGLSAADLQATPIPGTWSIHQIVVHLMDSDLIGSDRMKRIAAMPLPLICAYDESAFNRLPGIESLDLGQVCQVFELNRQLTASILRRLPDEAFDRCGIHTEAGKVTLAEMLEKFIQHLDYHLTFIAKKRALLGKPT